MNELGGNVCIECGTRVSLLYIKGTDVSTIRLVRCEKCLQVVDRYIEVDETLLLLDIILHRTQAYRHLLFNRKAFSSISLLSLVVLSVNYLIQVTAIRRALGHKEVELLWLRSVLFVILEHVVYSICVFTGLWLLSRRIAYHIIALHHMKTIYKAIAFPEIGKICAIVDCEPILLFFIGSLVLSIQHKSLESAISKDFTWELLLVIACAAVVRGALRLFVFGSGMSIWWFLM